MKQLNMKKEALIWLILLLPFVYAMACWNTVAALVPIRFDFQGHASSYASKEFALLGLPGLYIVLYLLLLFLPRIDPRKRNYEQFTASYQNIRLLVHLFLLCMTVLSAQASATGSILNIHLYAAALFLFFALLGNYLRTVRSNFFVGIRTPWTLSNDEVWRSTHQMAGRLWFYTGLVMALLCLILPESLVSPVITTVIIIIALIPIVYSYLEYRRLSKTHPEV